MKSNLMKKLLVLALTGAMALSMLTGCGKKSDNVINLYRATFNLAAVDQNQVDKVEAAINAFLKEKGREYTIELHDILDGEYADKVNTAIAANEVNLLWTASWHATVGTNDLTAADAVYDITKLVEGTTLYKSMAEGQWEAGKYDGKIFFIPVYKDNVEGYDLMFRQDLIDKYGFDLSKIKKLADIEPMLATLKEKEGLKYPYLAQKTAMFFRYYLDSFDFFTQVSFIGVDRAKNEVVNTVATPEYLEFCKLMGRWSDLGYISEDEATKTTPDTATQTKDWGISWWTDIPVNDEADERYKQDVTMTPITDRWAHSTSALGSCYTITKNCSEQMAKNCIDFMGLLYTENKLADIYTFGIEGKDFTYTADHRVDQSKNAKYNHGMWESASATIVSPLKNEPLNKAELYNAFNGGAKTSCAAGFRFDKSKVEAEFTACNSVYEQYGFVLETGGKPESEVAAFIEEYKKALDGAGYQKVLEEFKRQYNEWKK